MPLDNLSFVNPHGISSFVPRASALEDAESMRKSVQSLAKEAANTALALLKAGAAATPEGNRDTGKTAFNGLNVEGNNISGLDISLGETFGKLFGAK